MSGRYRDGIVTRAAHKWLRQRGFHVWKWPERTPNEGNKIRVLAGRCSMDSPEMANGVRINAEQDNGWLRVAVEADDSVKGWALSFNGRDIPIYVPFPQGTAVNVERTPEERLEELRFFVIEGDANFKHHLSAWMQEVERQIEALRVAGLEARFAPIAERGGVSPSGKERGE